MNDTRAAQEEPGAISDAEMMSALFAQLIMQQANMAMLLLGKVPNPQTGETVRDVEAARLFIDQLEMLEAKTKGNLTKDEEQLLKQSLMSLHMAFVEAIESPAPNERPLEKAAAADEKKTDAGTEPAQGGIEAPAGTHTEDAESKKKFSKKY